MCPERTRGPLGEGEREEKHSAAAASARSEAYSDGLLLNVVDGIRLSVPASLGCYTTYILLEQERWFERDIDFLGRWLGEGMSVVDVGANVGVFSLPLARLVGPTGKVFAFEPGDENRRHLEAGRLANDLGNLIISPCALADTEKEGWLQLGRSGELHALTEDAAGAAAACRVRVSSLDAMAQELAWPPIDFVKIDAEGQEARIIAGGRDLFHRHSPLVMYEIKQGTSINTSLRWMFEALGYRTYRLLGDATCLVPVGSDEQLDVDTINLYAAKPDRANKLAERDVLVAVEAVHLLTEGERRLAADRMAALPYMKVLGFSAESVLKCPYGDALIAYAAYRFADLPAARRHAALVFAHGALRDYCSQSTLPSPPAVATWLRIALDLGHRQEAHKALESLVLASEIEFDEPFFPPNARFDQLDPSNDKAMWFWAAAHEELELLRGYSSVFVDAKLAPLQWLCGTPLSSPEISRRLILKSLFEGIPYDELLAYLDRQHSHRNPEYWTADGLQKLAEMVVVRSASAPAVSLPHWPELRAASINRRLIKHLGKARPRYALVLSGETDFIQYFSSKLHAELRALSPEPFRLVEPGPEGRYAERPDLVLFVAHDSNQASKLWRLREVLGEDVVIAVWLWDNHTSFANNLHTAIAADVIFPSHAQDLGYLFNPVSVLAGHIPACSAQWTREEARRLFEELGELPRRHKLLANYVDYDYTARGEVLHTLERDVELAEVLLMPRDDRSRYFRKTVRDRFAEWCNYKATIILPVSNDLSTRVFDALLAGLVLVVPNGIPDFDALIPPETQSDLGVVRIDSYTPAELQAATVEALRIFDAQGAAGSRMRHRYALDNHLLINRVTSMLHVLWLYGQKEVMVEFGDGAGGPALYQVPAE